MGLASVSITKGTGPERPEVPMELLAQGNRLWMADCGYEDFDRFLFIDDHGSWFLTRAKCGLNPMVTSVIVYDNDQPNERIKYDTPTPFKQVMAELDRKHLIKPSCDVDVILSNGLSCRVIRSYLPDQQSSKRGSKAKRSGGFAYYYTNLPRDLFDLPQVVALYRARWSIEICWHHHKSYAGLKAERLLKDSTIKGFIYLSLAWHGLKTYVAKLVERAMKEPNIKLSLGKVAIHGGNVVLRILHQVMTSCTELEKLEEVACQLFTVMSLLVKELPSRINRKLEHSLECIKKKLSRAARVLTTSPPPAAQSR